MSIEEIIGLIKELFVAWWDFEDLTKYMKSDLKISINWRTREDTRVTRMLSALDMLNDTEMFLGHMLHATYPSGKDDWWRNKNDLTPSEQLHNNPQKAVEFIVLSHNASEIIAALMLKLEQLAFCYNKCTKHLQQYTPVQFPGSEENAQKISGTKPTYPTGPHSVKPVQTFCLQSFINPCHPKKNHGYWNACNPKKNHGY